MAESDLERLTFGMKPRNPVISASDPWIRKRSQFISPRKVHAIGEIALTWNAVEHSLVLLAASITRIDAKLAWTLFHDQGDIKLIEKIKLSEKIRPIPARLKVIFENVLKSYDQCRINRNSVIHAEFALDRNGASFKRKTKEYMKTTNIKESIGHLRRFADYIQLLANTIRHLSFCINHFNENGNFLALDGSGKEVEMPNTLPQPEVLLVSVPLKTAIRR